MQVLNALVWRNPGLAGVDPVIKLDERDLYPIESQSPNTCLYTRHNTSYYCHLYLDLDIFG